MLVNLLENIKLAINLIICILNIEELGPSGTSKNLSNDEWRYKLQDFMLHLKWHQNKLPRQVLGLKAKISAAEWQQKVTTQ